MSEISKLRRDVAAHASDDADTSWRMLLAAILNRGESVAPVTDRHSIGSNFGTIETGTRELLGHQFAVNSPRCRLVHSKYRHLNIGHAVAQLFWLLSGSKDARLIGFYHRFGLKFSESDNRIPGAPGSRVFESRFGDQLEHAFERLRRDQSSRRAVVQFFDAEDATTDRRDVPCFSALQFMVRRNKLVAIATMRSQSVLRVLPYDLFLLTMLQEIVASRLELDVGPYIHWMASAHLYESDLEISRQVIQERPNYGRQMQPMPRLAAGWRQHLVDTEQDVRHSLLRDLSKPVDLRRYQLDPYWTGLFAILVAAGRAENGGEVLSADIEQAPEELKRFVSHIPTAVGNQLNF